MTVARKWLLGLGLAGIILAVGLAVAVRVLAGRVEPYARQRAIQYLSQRFDSDVEIQALHIRVPEISPLRLLLTRRWGASARIEGEGLRLRKKGGAGAAPLISIRTFSGAVDLDSLFHGPVLVSHVSVDGMDIQIPPRSTRPASAEDTTPSTMAQATGVQPTFPEAVSIQEIDIHDGSLALLPRDPHKLPLRFAIQRLQLESKGTGALQYDASLTNAKPPGQIHTTGTFGPWRSREQGDTPIAGNYIFENADLGVFSGIAGTLQSSGQFEGRLSTLTVRGRASVPNFQLRRAGNAVPLTARFEALVDATNGNTILQPVAATLGNTNFTAAGGVIKHEANQPRAISLDVNLPNGELRDVLRLAMKQAPFMEGRLVLRTKVDLPPLAGKVQEKLILDGHFEIFEGKFHHSTIQAQLDGLSQRAQGRPGNQDADQAIARMTGAFHLENALIHFSQLSFGIPGANLDMAGDYNLDSDALDFAGTLKAQATLSQMFTGWKRKVLEPVDRLFERAGAGTFLRIRVNGTSKSPKFGLDFGHK
jgi:hypothetical protein